MSAFDSAPVKVLQQVRKVTGKVTMSAACLQQKIVKTGSGKGGRRSWESLIGREVWDGISRRVICESS